jgi:hypothetical protein
LEVQVDANTVIAICSVVIAVASLAVSAYVARATRKHNRLSVQPLLGFTTTFRAGGIVGLRLANSGLGPARIIRSQLTYEKERFGEFNKSNVDKFRRRLEERDHLTVRPHATTLGRQPFLDKDYQEFLLSIDPCDPSELDKFRQVIEGQLWLEIWYESIYGREGFKAVYYPRREVVNQFAEQLRSAFPAGAITRVQVLEYGDDPEVEPEEIAIRVLFDWPGRTEGKKADPKTVRTFVNANGAAIKAINRLRDELPPFIGWVELRPDGLSGAARDDGLAFRIGGRRGLFDRRLTVKRGLTLILRS